MKLSNVLFALAVAFPATLPANATPQSFDQPKYEILGEKCEAGNQNACRQLALETGGNCAGSIESGCRYSLEIINPEEPMVVLPALKFLGASRLSTIQHCAEIVKVTDWAILSTDSELEGMQLCLEEHT